MTSTLTPRSTSPVAAASPAMPAADHDDARRAGQRARHPEGRARRMAGATRICHRGASARKVCTMLRCQPGTVSLRTLSEAVGPQPVTERLGAVELVDAAPQVAVEAGVAAAHLAHRDDDRRAHRVPHGGRDPRVADRVLVHRQSRAWPQKRSELAQLRIGVLEVAQQVGGEDAVERSRRRPHPRCPRCGCARTGRIAGQRLAAASANMPDDASTATISACGATESNAAVDAPVPQPASSSRSPLPPLASRIRLRRHPEVPVIAGVGVHQAVVGRPRPRRTRRAPQTSSLMPHPPSFGRAVAGAPTAAVPRSPVRSRRGSPRQGCRTET